MTGHSGSAPGSTVDLDDAEALLAADHDGVLRAASMAGAQVRATATAVDEGALAAVRSDGTDYPPRTVVWVSTRGPAATAGTLLAAARGDALRAPLVLAAEAPAWIGSLDVLVIAGDDPGDPALVAAAAAAVRRGARVLVAAPYAGPLRDATAGRVAVLEPRIPVPAEFGLPRYLAAGLAVLAAVGDTGAQTDLYALADELDAEALRNSAGREVFTNPAKMLAERIVGRDVALAGDCVASLALARHGSAVMLRIGRTAVAAAGLADAVSALRDQAAEGAGGSSGIFHDEQIDGPADDRLRVLALTLAAERTVVAARTSGLDDVDLVGAGDVPMGPGGETAGAAEPVEAPASTGPGGIEQQLAVLAVRLEMAAAYVRFLRG